MNLLGFLPLGCFLVDDEVALVVGGDASSSSPRIQVWIGERLIPLNYLYKSIRIKQKIIAILVTKPAIIPPGGTRVAVPFLSALLI